MFSTPYHKTVNLPKSRKDESKSQRDKILPCIVLKEKVWADSNWKVEKYKYQRNY